jgi:hypothetical protein
LPPHLLAQLTSPPFSFPFAGLAEGRSPAIRGPLFPSAPAHRSPHFSPRRPFLPFPRPSSGPATLTRAPQPARVAPSLLPLTARPHQSAPSSTSASVQLGHEPPTPAPSQPLPHGFCAPPPQPPAPSLRTAALSRAVSAPVSPPPRQESRGAPPYPAPDSEINGVRRRHALLAPHAKVPLRPYK